MLDQNNEATLNRALELFHFAFRAFTTGPDAILAEQDLQRVHHRILYFVGRNPGISVNALLRILGVSKQALNGPLRTLIEKALISTTQDQQDRRIKRLNLSPPGQELESRLSFCQRSLMAKVFADAGDQSEQQWREIMRAIADTQFSSLLATEKQSETTMEAERSEC